MAFLFADGFDHYTEASDIHLDKWDEESTTSGFAVSSGNGQDGSDSARFTAGVTLRKFIPDTSEVVFGFWVSYGGTSASNGIDIFALYNDATILCALEYNAGRVSFIDKDNINYYLPGVFLRDDREYYIEGKVLVDATAGTVEIRVDGEVVMTRSGINTGSLAVDTVRFGPESSLSTIDFDDFYLLDTTGTTFNDFLGPLKIETLFPDGAGNDTDWSPSAGSNFQNVDESPPDGDTTYNSSSTVDDLDLYTFDNLSTTSGTVTGVHVNAYGRKDGASVRKITLAAREGTTTDSDGSEAGLSELYKFKRHMFETNPDTSSAWTISEVNGGEFGIKVSE